MRPALHAVRQPDTPAIVMAGGGTTTFADLQAASNQAGWQLSTLGLTHGDVDVDGYLVLTDRKSITIISGGVTIHPQEIAPAPPRCGRWCRTRSRYRS